MTSVSDVKETVFWGEVFEEKTVGGGSKTVAVCRRNFVKKEFKLFCVERVLFVSRAHE